MSRFTLPRDIYYGKDSLETLKTLKGKKAVIVLGGGSMKRFGFVDKAVAYLKEDVYKRQVIMVTAASDVAIVRELLSRGVFDYLVKPFECARFRQALARFAATRTYLKGDSRLEQSEIDRLLSHSGAEAPARLEKGLGETTLAMIRGFLKEHAGEAFSSEQVAEQVHLSRITIRRYMNYLLEAGEITSFVDYQTGGRPSIKYVSGSRLL